MSRRLLFDHWSRTLQRLLKKHHDFVAIWSNNSPDLFTNQIGTSIWFVNKSGVVAVNMENWYCDDPFIEDEAIGWLVCRRCRLEIPVTFTKYWRKQFGRMACLIDCSEHTVQTVMET